MGYSDLGPDIQRTADCQRRKARGNILLVEALFEHVTEIAGGFGKLGTSAESLAKDAARRMAGFTASNAFAGPHLADQLLLPFALAQVVGRKRLASKT